jgi:uncharacterized protein (TIGR04255 family)
MVKRGAPVPDKIKNDAIVEALLEIRFETSTIAEVFFGRLIDRSDWKNHVSRRIQPFDAMPQLYALDPNLRYTPTIEILVPESNSVLRFGPSVISFHRQPPYIGWSDFEPWLKKTIDSLFDTTDQLKVTRLGLRYLNALVPEIHDVSSITDLDVNLVVGGESLTGGAFLNFITDISGDSRCLVRVSTKDFVTGPKSAEAAIFVDVDVYTKDGFSTTDKGLVHAWLEDAHKSEKQEFFHLFTPKTIDAWRVK